MIKRFISYYGPHKKLFALDMFCALIVAVAGLFYPTIARDIINDYAHRDELAPLFFWSAVLLAIYILKALCNYVVGYLGHVVGVRMQRDMRRDLFLKYEALPISYYDENKTGDLLSRLVNDLFDVSELAHHGPENVFLSVLMLIGSFVILSNIYLPLALIMYSIIPIIVLVTVISNSLTATLPAAVASMGPATTGTPVASEVIWQRKPSFVPPPTIWIALKSLPVQSLRLSKVNLYFMARLS
jgi:ABC-type multidrug transport system fused ATPase/permease subunit